MHALIIGLGLIGGSIARTLKKNSDWTVSGYDINKESLDEALKSGAIDIAWDLSTPTDADITVLCMSPSATVAFLRQNAVLLKKDTVVTDVCGIKEWIVKSCDDICKPLGLHFIGGHPMAGKERNGFKNSDENLFNRASYILTPVDTTSDKAITVAKQYVSALRVAKITVTTPEFHDRMIAFTSQLPHIIAGAYVKSPSCLERRGFSAGSFKDVSRVATVDENLWSELFIKNRDALLTEIDILLAEITRYKIAIENSDMDVLKDTIKQGRLIKENDIKETDREKRNTM